jgi:hypothetical protein
MFFYETNFSLATPNATSTNLSKVDPVWGTFDCRTKTNYFTFCMIRKGRKIATFCSNFRNVCNTGVVFGATLLRVKVLKHHGRIYILTTMEAAVSRGVVVQRLRPLRNRS